MLEDTQMILNAIGELKAEFSQMKTEMNELRTEVNELRTEVNELKAEMNELKAKVNQMEDKLNYIGIRIENEFIPNVHLVAEGHTDLVDKLNYLGRHDKYLEELRIHMNILETGFSEHLNMCKRRHEVIG